MNRIGRMIRAHRILATTVGAAVAFLVIVAAALFQPWRLFTSSSVNEALPLAPPASTSASPSTAPTTDSQGNGSPSPNTSASAPAGNTDPVVLGFGNFQSQEHQTSGTAQLLELPDGSRVLRLENLASSDGPDVKVWLSSLEAGGDWYKYRSDRYVDLGPVKATHGNQNYVIPAAVDLSGLQSVVLWCDRFSVAFGSAQLA
ncbi:DM13 domain-containing protein [Paenarthrobacter sp. RAF54_2]|uniref:DM13 domain-containing protein n=1 Tax=Paenarthrobacter sp. RAF54_2 TaxID=3233061 RepID=UPI003F9D07C5